MVVWRERVGKWVYDVEGLGMGKFVGKDGGVLKVIGGYVDWEVVGKDCLGV